MIRSPLASSLALAMVLTGVAGPPLVAQKLRVYVLAGQSNMQGHAKVETFDYLGDDPKTAPWLAEMRDSKGQPTVCQDVWISYLTGGRGGNGEGFGKLSAGWGARSDPTKDGGKIGPEFTFGLQVAKAQDGPVLLIKTAWGGKSLHTDFRSPSAGPFEFSKESLARLKKQNKDIAKIQAERAEKTGHYYRLMIEHVRRVLADPARVCSAYDPKQGFELAGFVWFQGWNDMVDRGVYPKRDQPGGYDAYSECMAHFIRDVRKDLATPDLPFVIGVMGVGGKINPEERSAKVHGNFRTAMAAVAALPEFRGTVAAVETAPFWCEELEAIQAKQDKVRQMSRMLRTRNKKGPNADGSMTPKQQRAYLDKYRLEVVGAEDLATLKRGASNAGYHYLGAAKTMAGIGRAFADAVLAMRRD